MSWDFGGITGAAKGHRVSISDIQGGKNPKETGKLGRKWEKRRLRISCWSVGEPRTEAAESSTGVQVGQPAAAHAASLHNPCVPDSGVWQSSGGWAGQAGLTARAAAARGHQEKHFWGG